METLVTLSHKFIFDMKTKEWLDENCGARGEGYYYSWDHEPDSIYFKKSEDALAFKIKFML